MDSQSSCVGGGVKGGIVVCFGKRGDGIESLSCSNIKNAKGSERPRPMLFRLKF